MDMITNSSVLIEYSIPSSMSLSSFQYRLSHSLCVSILFYCRRPAPVQLYLFRSFIQINYCSLRHEQLLHYRLSYGRSLSFGGHNRWDAPTSYSLNHSSWPTFLHLNWTSAYFSSKAYLVSQNALQFRRAFRIWNITLYVSYLLDFLCIYGFLEKRRNVPTYTPTSFSFILCLCCVSIKVTDTDFQVASSSLILLIDAVDAAYCGRCNNGAT